ncbi:hypothetical protein GcM1_127004, partial [Golovinomyces cichoracearum]
RLGSNKKTSHTTSGKARNITYNTNKDEGEWNQKLPKKQAAAIQKPSENNEQMKNPLAPFENLWVKVARKGNKKARVSTAKDISPIKETLNV